MQLLARIVKVASSLKRPEVKNGFHNSLVVLGPR
jgi:hypothetical protein